MYRDFSTSLSADLLLYLGLISAGLSIVAFLPYIRDVARRQTMPERATWLIWSVLGTMSVASQIAEGATSSLWFALIQVGGTVIIFLQSIRYGRGGYFSKRNQLVLGAAACGLFAWYMTDTSAYALGIAIGISLLGGAVTIRKTYRDPQSETLIAWSIALLATTFAIMSVGALDPLLLAYPVYLFCLYAGIVGASILGRRKIRGAYQLGFDLTPAAPQAANYRSPALNRRV